MLRAADIIAAVATSLNLPVAEVTQHGRYLREWDLFVRETKSPRSWRAGPADAAALFAAALTGAPIVRVADAVMQLRDFTDPAEENRISISTCGALDAINSRSLCEARNFLEAISGLLCICQSSLSKTLDLLADSFVDYDTTRIVGRVVLRAKSPVLMGAPSCESEHILRFGDVGDSHGGETGALRRWAQIDFSAFRQLGAVLAHSDIV